MTYPIVALIAVILAAAVLAGYIGVLHRRERYKELLASARFKRFENIDGSLKRLSEVAFAVVPPLIGIVRKRITGNDGVVFGGPETEAGILSFLSSLGPEQFQSILAILTPAQQIQFVELARTIRDRTDAASGKSASAAGPACETAASV